MRGINDANVIDVLVINFPDGTTIFSRIPKDMEDSARFVSPIIDSWKANVGERATEEFSRLKCTASCSVMTMPEHYYYNCENIF